MVRAVLLVPVGKPIGSKASQKPVSSTLPTAARLAEAHRLVQAIGLDVRFSGTVMLLRPQPGTLFGEGKVAEVAAIVSAERASLVIVDHPLSPVQQRNLEKAWGAKVIDRTGLILEIFADRAHSKEGRLQVELAQLTYQRSRLVRSWTHLERQRGGFGFLGGPGETQIETDRRAIGERIDTIRGELAVIERTRRLHRKRRKTRRQQIVSLVGYTNAGKSTLFNALSGAGVLAKDMLFATLDPTLRRVSLPGGRGFILSDTVGFISELPTQLIAAFRATLEEILEADLILHVRDISSETSEAEAAEVERVLGELGIDAEERGRRVIEVWNKADLLAPDRSAQLAKRTSQACGQAVLVSAATGSGIAELINAIGKRLQKSTHFRDVVVDNANGSLIHWLYENAEVLDRHDRGDGHLLFHVRIASECIGDLDRHLRRASH